MTLAPVANQIGIEINKKNIGKAAHTEASAVSEINFQTIIVSAILYICWITFPINIGIANRINVLVILHSVRSFIIFKKKDSLIK